MAVSKCGQAPQSAALTSQSDLQLLNVFTSLVCREQSLHARELACEIIRRFTVSREEQTFQSNCIPSFLGIARWGDAKRVFDVFGLKRGPLDRIRKAGLIVSRSMEEDCDEDEPSAVRAKRLYDLISIEQYLRSPESKSRGHTVSVTAAGRSRVISTGKKKQPLKIMQK